MEADTELGPVELEHTEHVLIWAFRAMAIGRGDCPLVRREFNDCCGRHAADAFAALFVLVRQLGWRGRRSLKLHLPGCRAISGDELGILAAIGAAQEAASDGGPDRLQAWLHWLLDGPPEPLISDAVKILAAALAANGRRVAAPEPAPSRPLQRALAH